MSIDEVLDGTRQWWIELGDAGDVLKRLPPGCAKLILLDAPWSYAAGRKGHGRATEHYETLPMRAIAEHIAASYRVATDPAYLMMWYTFPCVEEWFERHSKTVRAGGWHYATGGAWGKMTGQGIGYYAWGDAEGWALYTKGKAVPDASKGKPSSLLLTARVPGHSIKPTQMIDAAIECYTAPGDVVLDFYAGNSGVIARVCRRLDRRYIGVEIDPKRREEALIKLAQQELELVG